MPAPLTVEDVQRILTENPAAAGALTLRTSEYWPEDWQPTAKQTAYLMLPHREAFFGGAAGGGKSEALLACALQYVNIPGYAALIIRKTLSDLKLPSSLLARAHEWLAPRSDCAFMAGEHSYYFPTKDDKGRPAEPAKIVFGYIGQVSAEGQGVRTRYQSAEFQTVCFDELTQHFLPDYLYMFSRMRKRVCPKHKLRKEINPETKKEETVPNYVDDCWWCQTYKSMPLRIRSASNPGNSGHGWVKDRFGIKPLIDPATGHTRYIGTNPDRPYIPAFVWDNPFIDQAGYLEGLSNLDPVTREQLKQGDWGVSKDSRFKANWVRRYSIRGRSYVLGTEGRGEVIPQFTRVFTVVDPAGSAREGPGDTDRFRKQESWTVIMTFGLTINYHLLILDVRRFRKEIPEIIPELQDVYRVWRPDYIVMEGSGLGKGAYQLAQMYGLPVKPVFPVSDKVVRSTDAQVRMEQGRVWLPEPPGDAWLEPLEAEIFTWTGHPQETDDQIDCLSMGAKEVSWEAAAVERVMQGNILTGEPTPDLPSVVFSGRHFGAMPTIPFFNQE